VSWLLVAAVTFLAAAVEWVEALTIVLAVGLFKGWRSAFVGAGLALAALVALVLIFGLGLAAVIPIVAARAVVGVFLLLFGLKWLQRAVLRSSGLKAMHDEARVFEEEKKHLLAHGSAARGLLDPVGTFTSFNGVLLEGLEVAFIVLALGVSSMAAAAGGALVSLVAVVAVGAVFRAPLTRVPENTMKYVVGIMLTSFGTFFAGEGIGVRWWDSDASILVLVVVYSVGSVLLVRVLKRPPSLAPGKPPAPLLLVRGVAMELWGLFVGDSALALVVIIALLAVALYANLKGQRTEASILLVAGVIISMVVGIVEPYRARASEIRSAALSLSDRTQGAVESASEPEDASNGAG